ncbi:MAG: hypothetical protein Q9159_005541, partial [Coniocarpon cinnabarinum]
STKIHFPLDLLFNEKIKGHDFLDVPSYSFLITHGARHVLFDLGARKDLENLAPKIRERAMSWGKAERNVADIIDEGSLGIGAADIESVILSHHHWDHIGTMTSFPKSTAIWVGPGFKDALIPGYPTNPDSPMLEADMKDRIVHECSVSSGRWHVKAGPCDAFDFFGDGSFFLLNTPGHAPGHLAALARTTHSPDTFMLLAGDACHHGGEIRPTAYHPLPREISPSPSFRFAPCPGLILQKLQSNHSVSDPFYTVRSNFPSNFDECEKSLRKVEELDSHDCVLVAMAHDPALKDLLRFYPETANDWKASDVKSKSKWLFLQDFQPAIDETSETTSEL